MEEYAAQQQKLEQLKLQKAALYQQLLNMRVYQEYLERVMEADEKLSQEEVRCLIALCYL